MKKQKYIKPQTETVVMESIDLMAATVYSVKKDGSGIDLFGTYQTGGDAGEAASKESSDIWGFDDEE